MRRVSIFKSVVAVVISLSLVVLSPGFAAYEAAAQQVTGTKVGYQAATPGSGQVGTIKVLTGGSMTVSPLTLDTANLGSTLPGVAAPSIKETPVQTLESHAGLPVAVPVMFQTPVRLPVVPIAAPETVQEAAPVQSIEDTLAGMSGEVGQALEATGDISKARTEGAHGLGMKLDSIITRAKQAFSSDVALVPSSAKFGDLNASAGVSRLAAPDAAPSPAEVSPNPEAQPSVSDAEPQAPRSRKQPLGARIFASALALLPAAILGWPLLAAGALYAGGAVIATSVLMAALPFMGEGTPKAIRAIPGFSLAALGAFTVFNALTGGSGLWIGALAALGGWGLVRYGLGKSVRDRWDTEAALSAYFGGVGALTGAALALIGPAGWIALGFTVLSYPMAALLLMHLPSWVGYGISTAFGAAYYGVKGVGRIMGAAWRDTPLVDRLKAFSERHLKVSKWNAVWLAGLWIPVWTLQMVGWAAGIVSWLALSAMQAPVMFLWGASHRLSRESRVTKYFAAVAHFMFDNVQGAKKALFNRAEKLLIGAANSKSKALSIPATLGIYLMSLGAAVLAVAATPFLFLGGVAFAFAKTSEAYDPAKHSPSSLRVDTDDSPGEKPEEPADPDQPAPPPGSTLVPRLIASAIALLPAVFLGWPLYLASPMVGVFYGAVTLSLALLPFMPAKTAKVLRILPGVLMILQGVLIPYLTFMVGPIGIGALLLATAKTNAFWMSVANILGGWGLMRFLSRKAEDPDEFSMDSGERIGAYFGALALMTGAGLVFTGATGLVATALTAGAYLLSPLLLMHLPKPIFTGLGAVFYRIYASVRNSYELFSSWNHDTKFYRNLRSHASYWLDKTVWNGAWLSVIWVPMWISQLVEFVLAGAVGLALGVVRAPLNFLWGLSHELWPDSRATRFFSGTARVWESMVEGDSSQEFFKYYSRGFLKAMDEKSASPSGRPTVKAGVSFVMFRLGQAFYLLKMAFLLPVGLVMALAFGIYNATKGKPNERAEDPFRFWDPYSAPGDEPTPAPASFVKKSDPALGKGAAIALTVGALLLAAALLGWPLIAGAATGTLLAGSLATSGGSLAGLGASITTATKIAAGVGAFLGFLLGSVPRGENGGWQFDLPGAVVGALTGGLLAAGGQLILAGSFLAGALALGAGSLLGAIRYLNTRGPATPKGETPLNEGLNSFEGADYKAKFKAAQRAYSKAGFSDQHGRRMARGRENWYGDQGPKPQDIDNLREGLKLPSYDMFDTLVVLTRELPGKPGEPGIVVVRGVESLRKTTAGDSGITLPSSESVAFKDMHATVGYVYASR